MIEYLSVKKENCSGDGQYDCFFIHQERLGSMNERFLAYELFQHGLIFTSLVAGVVCLLDILVKRGSDCKNIQLTLTTVITGLVHMVVCFNLLKLSENSADFEIPRGGSQNCMDYHLPATLSNSIVLVSVSVNVIRQISVSRATKIGMIVAICSSVITGLYLNSGTSQTDSISLNQNSVLSIGNRNTTHLDVFWSICLRDLAKDWTRIASEYGFIYLPIAVVVLIGWYESSLLHKDTSLLKMKIITPGCCDEDGPCICSHLNTSYVAVIAYSVAILLVARPIMLLYSASTSGTFRDILPSLLQTVLYCFVCSEYIIWMVKTKVKGKNILRSKECEVFQV